MENARDHLFDLGSLENYTFTDENGKDQGINGERNIVLFDIFKSTSMMHFKDIMNFCPHGLRNH